MAVVMYQRAEPREKQWLPLLSQQVRLRNVSQVLVLNGVMRDEMMYVTIHVSPMSAPFFTTDKVQGNRVTAWNHIYFTNTKLSATGAVFRVWTGQGKPLFSWGIQFKGLHYLGQREEWNPKDFKDNTLIISTPYGSFTSIHSLLRPPVLPQRFLQIRTPLDNTRNSYTLKNLVALHRLQRSLLEEFDIAEKFKVDVGFHGYKGEMEGRGLVRPKTVLSDRLLQRVKLGQGKLRLKEEIEMVKLKVSSLTEEKGRAEGRVGRLKKDASRLEQSSSDLIGRIHNFSVERVNLKDTKTELTIKGQHLRRLRGKVFLRKKQLISELLQIYPLALVEGSKRYSINGVQLPNAEDYGNEGGGQVSVALGYTAHLVAMLSFFLDIPSRYSIRHFGSRSRIIDHITVQIPDKEREFPLYFKGKRDVYCAYAVYLLNKNVGQLRWYCAMSTPDLRATLPNLVELISSRLIIPGWPPNLVEALEIAQEITEEIDSNVLQENEMTRSLDQGLDKILGNQGEGGGEIYLKGRRESFTENPGGNSTALGEIQHGRGQERFLSGWKKKTYVETDDFDPKWLLDSMNLDFDTSRRFSITSTSSPLRHPINDPSADSEDNVSSRRRRIGQVEPPALSNLEESSLSGHSAGVLDKSQPENIKNVQSKDIVQLEHQIKEMERRKSRVISPTVSKGADTPLTPVLKTSELKCEEINNWISDDIDDNNMNVEVDSHHLSSSGFGVGKTSEVCDSTTYHIPPPLEEPQVGASLESSVCVEANLIPFPITLEASEKATNVDKEEVEKLGGVDFKVTSACDSSDVDNGSDSALWIRTEALLGAQSFNLLRRRMSEST